MSTPAVPSPPSDFTESVTFILQAINGAGNVLFNRKETLTAVNGASVSFQDGIVISAAGTNIITPVDLHGLFVFNIDPTAVVEIVGVDSGFAGNIKLTPFGAVCIFNPETGTGINISISTDTDGSKVSVAYWE